MLRLLLVTLLFIHFLLLDVPLSAQPEPMHYSRVKIWLEGKPLSAIGSLGIAIDHGQYKKGIFFIGDLSDREINKLEDHSFRFDTLIPDLKKYYTGQIKQGPADKTSHKRSFCTGSSSFSFSPPSNFMLGSMGGYFTYEEMFEQLDSMKAKFPDLISSYNVIDSTLTTEKGRYLYWLRISDNPGSDEAEPEILYNALHHAREPGSLSQLIFYMWYLLENYASDPDIRELIDNTEMYFVPCVNPDGYVYNQTNDPNGGGLWRKNLRSNGNGEFGVDLNRNYGYKWGWDDVGSSPDPGSDVYRGTAAFSEPENQTMRNFCMAHDFRIALNYHTYGGFLIYPWGYEEQLLTPDSLTFERYASMLTADNHYVYGTGDQTLNYTTNGDSDDWMYGEQIVKNKILSMTPEVGEDFWEPSNDIIPTCMGTLHQNLTAAKLLLEFYELEDLSPGILALDGHLLFDITRLGLQDADTVAVSLIGPGGVLAQAGTAALFTNLQIGATIRDSIYYYLQPDSIGQTLFPLILAIDYNNGKVEYDTIYKYYGDVMEVALYEPANNTGLWNMNGNWSETSLSFVSAPSSLTDSPFGDYNGNETNIMTLDTIADLTDAVAVTLEFYGRWDIEADYDYAQVLASVEGQNNWTPLCGRYTKTGGFSPAASEPHYDGYSNWVRERIDLQDWLGERIQLRFQMVSDAFVEGDGFYLDDLIVNKVKELPEDTTTTSAFNDINDVNSTIFIGEGFPNPTDGVAYFDYELKNTGTNSAFLEIIDLFGRKLYSYHFAASSKGVVKVDLQHFSAGIYFYRLKVDSQYSVVKKLSVY